MAERSRPQTPRTWFERLPTTRGDADTEAWLTLGAALVFVAVPLVALMGALTYGMGRLVRAKWWW
ncbi:MAG: hypothetical protein ACRDV9_13280, partial [Acidimicrobiia bacterium]